MEVNQINRVLTEGLRLINLTPICWRRIVFAALANRLSIADSPLKRSKTHNAEEYIVADGDKSLTWVVAMVMIAIALFGWGFLAGSYAGAHAPNMSEMTAEELKDLGDRTPERSRRGALEAFIGNALEQLPNFPTVISWHMSNRAWLPITIVVLEVGAVLGGFVLKRVEKALEAPRKSRW